MKKTIPKIWEWEGMKTSIPEIREREGNAKIIFPHFGNGNQRLSFQGIPGNWMGMKKI